MAAASKGFGYAREEKVMKEIRGGLPEKDANKGFLGVSIGLLIIIVFCGWVLCREGTGVCETIICMGAIYLIMLNFFIKVSKAYVIDETGVTITFFNFKIWTVHFNWDEYYEVKFGTTRKNEAGVDFVMSFATILQITLPFFSRYPGNSLLRTFAAASSSTPPIGISMLIV